jgi:hypothetical protein
MATMLMSVPTRLRGVKAVHKPRVALREGVRLAATWYRTHSQPDASSMPAVA